MFVSSASALSKVGEAMEEQHEKKGQQRRPASQAGKEGIAHGFQMSFIVLFYPPHSRPGKSQISYLGLFTWAIGFVLVAT